MKYSALIGNPTEHSVSHILYEQLLEAAGYNLAYKHIKVDVKHENLAESISAFNLLNFVGLSVTLPHKLAVIPLLDRTDSVVDALGAVNTIKLGDKTVGYNTDWLGIYRPLSDISKQFDSVTILGTGGASRAALYAAKRLNAKTIYMHYRSRIMSENTKDLMSKSEKLGIELREYSQIRDSIKNSDLIINATSAGMVGKAEAPFDLRAIEEEDLKNKVFFDAVFNPLETPLLRHFASHNAKTVDGLWMMIYQGIAALEIWLEKDISVTREQLDKTHSSLSQELKHV